MNNKQEHYNNFDFNTFFIRIFFIRMMNNKNWQKIKNTLVNNNAQAHKVFDEKSTRSRLKI